MKNLIFKSSFHEKLKMLLIAVGLLVTSLTTQVWAYDAHFSLMGDPLDNGWAKDTKYMINTSTGTTDEWYIYVYVAKNQYFALNNGSNQYGPSSNGSAQKDGSGGGQGAYNSNSWKFTGTSGIIKICCAESSNREWYPWVWVEESAPTIKFKHPWNGGSWTEQTATKQSDGTYQYKGKYGGTAGFNAGYSSNFKYNASATTVTGSPASGDDCYFIWNPVGYVRGTQDYDNGNTQSEHCGTFTIVKLCGLTYDGNGRTGGTAVPSALSNQKYGTSITLSSVAMTKTGYTLTGWNTANDGSGTHYDLGASFTFSDKTNTLYAEWTQDITIDKNGGTSAGSMSICFNAGSLKSFTAATKTDWILDSYWTTADESGSKVIEYDASTGSASLVSSLSGYITTGKWTRTTTTKLYAHWKQTYRVTYYANYPTGATSTGGSVPTDATEYEKNATVTVKSNSGSLSAGGFTFAGWNTQEDGQGTNYTAGSGTFSISEPTNLYAKWTENLTTVTVNINTSGAGTLTIDGAAFTPGNTTTAGVVTSRTVVATPQPGYRYSSWSKSGNATGTNSTNTYTLKGNGSGGTGTLTANFARSYAYIQGRMTIWSTSARSTALHVASSEGGWDVSSTRIQMDYDGTNNRFYRHTYKTPAELSAEQSGNEQYFFFKTSTSSTSLTSAATFRPSSGQTLTAAGVGNKKATTSSSGDNSVWFNSNTSNGYVILYFDQAGVWYELEHTLKYDGNGSTGGSAPASETYYNNGSSATASSSSGYTKTNYTFGGWNTSANIDGTPYAAGASITMTANTTLYTKWTRSITLNQNSATTDGSTSVTATYNCSTLPSITAPEKTGYTFGGWYTANDGSGYYVISTSGALQASKSGWTGTGGIFTRTANTATLYAKWTQTITLNYNSANHGSGSNKSATVIYNKDALSTITHCTPATGYHRVGYYTDATGGTKVLNADGTFAGTNVSNYITSGKWTKAGATTLYAQYEVNTYTIHYDPNDTKYVGEATGSMDNQAATWGNYPTLTSNGFTREGYTFAGWATSPTGAVVYSNGQTLSTNLTNDNNATVTLYAKWTGRTYTVTFNARGGSSLSPASKTVTMGATYGTLATVTPPAGYVFDGWYTSAGGGTKVTSATQVTTAVDHTLYAHYIQKAQVYFKNTLGWSQVWVTYDANWDGTQGTGNQGKTYHRMNLVPGTTDVYYDDIPDEYLTSWRWNIAFNNLDYSSTPFYAFDNGEAVYRMDFDKKSTMFVPTSATGATDDGNFKKNNDKVQYRSTGYTGDGGNPKYTSGYWRTYNNTYSGYTMTYQKKNGSWSNGHKMESSSVSDNIFVYTVHMDANSQYNFAFYKERDVNTKSVQFCYDNTTQINSGNCTNLKLDCNPNNSYMQTTVEGDYVFKLEMKNDGHMYLTVVYPFGVGDYRVRYSYTKGSAKTYYSEIIKGRANGKDTISIFIHSADSASSRVLKIERCTTITSGSSSWNTSYAPIDLPAKTAAGQTYDGKTTSGVYNFIISQNGSKAASGAFWKKYEGNYYIRTASADGGWDFYKERSDNQMTLSEYSLTQTLSAPFSHYYCRFISEAERSTTDISYAIATDYSPNISGTMVGDATIGGDAVKVLPASANVRFSWNEETNAMRRAYLKNAQTENARFLVLHGSDNKVLSATGSTISAKDDLQANELKFTDMGNWIYQVNLQAQPGAKVSLIANYNSADRYLIGGESSFLTIIDGTGSAKYEMIAVYDFKTNRLMIAWTPSGEVGQNLTDVDVLLVRYKQNAGTLITLGTGKSVTSKTVIGAIRFDYNDLVGHVANWNNNSRPLLKYFISFPFDVNVSDIFGLNSAYGDAYEIQTYDGAERARKGFFRGDGTTTFWRTLQPGEVMKANEGYCVIMDNDYLNNDIGHVWDNKVAGSSVYLYFPSASSVGSIASSSKTIAIPERTCSIDRPFVSTQAGGRTVSHQNTDSHWSMMGIPIFANTTDGTFKYFYAWNSDNNQFAINTASGYTFNSMHGYMVQYYGNVTFTGAHTNLPTSVARRAPAESHQIELQVLNSDEEVLNRAYVELRENACDTFMLNEDVYMWTTNQAVDIYTFAGNYDVSANVLSLNDQMIPVGVEVRKAGTYIFSMPSNFSGTATLVDTFTGARTNLALSDYEVELEKGIITDRFLLELSIEKVTTVMETVNGGGVVDTDVRKVLIDGVLYIVKDGKVFDARGARVQ